MAYQIVAVRREPSDDMSHDHIALVGFVSGHLPGDEIYVSPARIGQRALLGEKFVVEAEGDKVEVGPGKCPECGHEPHLKTAKDGAGRQYLLELPYEYRAAD